MQMSVAALAVRVLSQRHIKLPGCSVSSLAPAPWRTHSLERPGFLLQIRAGAAPGAAYLTSKAPRIRCSRVVELGADRWNHMGKLIIFFSSFFPLGICESAGA